MGRYLIFAARVLLLRVCYFRRKNDPYDGPHGPVMGINLEGHQCSKKARRASNLDWIAISPKPSLHTLGLRMSVIRMSVAPGPVRADNAELYARPFASNPPGRHA